MCTLNTPIGRVEYEERIRPYFLPSQASRILLAYRLAKYAHCGQTRQSGERYFEHPKQVSLILLDYSVYDDDIIVASLLHDVMEDSFLLTWDDLEQVFGSRVCRLVKLVTKEPGLGEEAYFARLAQGDPDAWVVKLADRLHNLLTLDCCSREKQVRQVEETRTRFLPLCRSLTQRQGYADLGRQLACLLDQVCRQYSD